MLPLVFCLFGAASALLSARVALQFFQLESNQLGGYFRSLRRNTFRAFLPGIAVTAAGCALLTLLTRSAFEDGLLSLGIALTMLFACLVYFLQRRLPTKRPLIFTPRVYRLIGFLAAVCLGCAAAFVYWMKMPPLVLFLPLFSPLLLALAAALALPQEMLINHLYLRDAMKRLDAMPHLVKIGITGSYGKTSVKFMLETILCEKFRVLATWGSFNTSMGVTRVIRERLSPDHQVFIAEMGARHRGDIRLLCKLVRPQYGIITSVGPQHLETFRTQENICNEKFELARAIPQSGAVVFAADDGLSDALYEKAQAPKHLAGSRVEGLGLTARDVEVGPWGSRFILCDGATDVFCQTRVLGAHNINNLLMAATMARVLGMDLRAIARGIGKVKPIEHRLALMPDTGQITVIDDAFNANPVGAQAALDVLRCFPGRRIIITPGFVELGQQEAKYNRAFGEYMADCVDIAILVGFKHTLPIATGLRSKKFNEENLHIVTSLDEAIALLADIRQPGDVELYENDLPDNYQE